MALVKNTKPRKWLLIAVFGVGIAMMIVLWNMDSGSPENHAQPQANGIDQMPGQESGTIADDNSLQPAGQQKQVAAPPSDSTDLPDPDETPPVVETNLTEGGETAPDGSKIYTMDTLPMDKSGTYWVKDADGNVQQIAVDVSGPDSPVGLYE